MRSFVPAIVFSTLVVAAGCSASDSLSAFEDRDEEPGSTDAGATVRPPPEAGGFADAAPPAPSDERRNSVVVVNASARVPAFRICPAASEDGLLSNSSTRPFPTTRMPGSNIAGLDVGGAVRLDPTSPEVMAVSSATSVLLVLVDDDTKFNQRLATGTCAEVACTGGTGCVGAQKIRRVEVRNGSFARGNVVVLRDDPKDTFFDVQADPFTASDTGLQFAYRNFSDTREPLAFVLDGKPFPLAPGATTSVPEPALAGSLHVGNLVVPLATLHSDSEPATDPSTFFRGTLGLFLVGQVAPAEGASAYRLKLVAVPLRAPERTEPADASAP